jgi:CDGSH-type Zn-finger protein
MTVTKDGPYAVTGAAELAGVAFGDGASREHYTLCRCGASANKPFCDGSHWRIEFHDPA